MSQQIHDSKFEHTFLLLPLLLPVSLPSTARPNGESGRSDGYAILELEDGVDGVPFRQFIIVGLDCSLVLEAIDRFLEIYHQASLYLCEAQPEDYPLPSLNRTIRSSKTNRPATVLGTGKLILHHRKVR